MEKPYIVDQKFEKESTLALGEYEHCVFKNCQFESADFKNFQFVDCSLQSQFSQAQRSSTPKSSFQRLQNAGTPLRSLQSIFVRSEL
jgi:hypothetical protein